MSKKKRKQEEEEQQKQNNKQKEPVYLRKKSIKELIAPSGILAVTFTLLASSVPVFVTFILYVLTVPSSAVTFTFTVFVPSRSPLFPVISTVAFSSSASASITKFSTSLPIVKLYSVISGLKSGSNLYCSTVKDFKFLTFDLSLSSSSFFLSSSSFFLSSSAAAAGFVVVK